MSSKRSLRKLSISSPSRHPAQTHTQPPLFPRITTKLNQVCAPAINFGQLTPEPDHAVHGDRRSSKGARDEDAASRGYEGCAFGAGWVSLQELALDNLSQQGVSLSHQRSGRPFDFNNLMQAKNISAHFVRVAHLGGAPLRKLSISTHFLDSSLSASIGRVGALGTLTHLELGTTGTKFSGEALKGIIEACRGLESLRLKDLEGKSAWYGGSRGNTRFMQDGWIRTPGSRSRFGR